MTLQEIPSESFRERSIPVLETERLVLRAPRLGDAKTVAMLANDRRIAENTARIPHPYRAADAEDFIATANLGNEAVFMIALRNGAKEQVIGACGFTQIDRHPPEIGYWLGIKHWGKGYATEAVRAVIDHTFADLDCDAIHASARVTNPASRRVLEMCGFQWTGAGLLRIRALSSSAPIDRFRLDRGLWASLKSWGQAKLRVA
ncbi:MAG: GNAT family N-acetyltransferase [Alphaproteobacteria bacterium]|nr:GNAT family N-acetyltransferase [Alphaproteobacteria bacterium]